MTTEPTERDELTVLIQKARRWANVLVTASNPTNLNSRGYITDLANALEAATPRTISSVEELHGLPLGSVILDSDPAVLQMVKKSAIAGAEWAMANEEYLYTSGKITLPATLLHDGGKA